MRSLSLMTAAALLCAWLLLNGSASIADILLGAVLGVVLVTAAAPFRQVRAGLRRPGIAASLFLAVLLDIVRSNLAVAAIIMDRERPRTIRSGSIVIPLELRDPHALAVLAMIITSTPGTVWQGVSADGRELRLHVLDLVDEQVWVRKIKQQYEKPLKDIFE